MISNQILQTTLDGIKEITKTDLCVMDMEGKVLAYTMEDPGKYTDEAKGFARSAAQSQVISGCQFIKVMDGADLEFILLADGDDNNSYMVGRMASFQLQSLVVAYKERFDRDNFIKNLLMENLLLVDIYSRAKKLHIDADVKRAVFIIETNRETEGEDMERLREHVASPGKDFITAVDEKSLILVKELSSNSSEEELEKVGNSILRALRRGTDDEPVRHVAYGTSVTDLKDVPKSYKEGKTALEVGRIFFDDRKIVAYSILGIGRLIYQLPMPLCRMFIKEIFGEKSPDRFDKETVSTINKFFENSLNVSETARQLYIHRNTLVYRLDKLQKQTGLDLRVFEDAITFKIAMMVVKYMNYTESMEQL